MKLVINNSTVKLRRDNDVALVTGDGKSFLDDMDNFLKLELKHDVFSIGRSVKFYPYIVKHWVNVDGADSKWWAEHLPTKNNGQLPVRHTMGDCQGYDVDWEVLDDKLEDHVWHGSSSLFAVYIALHMEYPKIVLAGCPLDDKGHWFFEEEICHKWKEKDYQAWRDFAKLPEAKRVESLSGMTKEILSEPHNKQ